MKIKNAFLLICATALLFSTFSCEKDEGLLPDISFKTGGNYISTDVTLAAGTSITMGINASKTEDKDVLKQFDISKSINGGTPTSVFNKALSGSEGDNYNYDFTTTVESTPGQQTTYTFTVTNRDGLYNQVSVTVTTQ